MEHSAIQSGLASARVATKMASGAPRALRMCERRAVSIRRVGGPAKGAVEGESPEGKVQPVKVVS